MNNLEKSEQLQSAISREKQSSKLSASRLDLQAWDKPKLLNLNSDSTQSGKINFLSENRACMTGAGSTVVPYYTPINMCHTYSSVPGTWTSMGIYGPS